MWVVAMQNVKHDEKYDDNDDEINDDDDKTFYQITMGIWKKQYASDTMSPLLS